MIHTRTTHGRVPGRGAHTVELLVDHLPVAGLVDDGEPGDPLLVIWDSNGDVSWSSPVATLIPPPAQPEAIRLGRAMFAECKHALGDNAHRFSCDEMDAIVAAARALGIMYADELLDIHARQDAPGDRHYQGPPP